MNPDVIQFSCGACQHVLTVPAHLAGISGPCPVCGNTVTSPAATPAPVAAPAFFAPPPQAPGLSGSLMGSPGAGMPSFPSAAPSFPQPAAPAAPAWQPPGLGQTILETAQQPSFPQSPLPAASPQPPPSPMDAGFLPPRRMDGQVPFTGSLNPMAQGQPLPQQPMWGAGLPPAPAAEMSPPIPQPRQAGGQPHSSLIPGSPTLPMMGSADSGQMGGGSLLGRPGMPSVPLNPMSAAPADSGSGAMPGLNLPASPGGRAASRPMRKPKRSANVFMVGLALLLLGGFLATTGWLFREPIMQVVDKVKGMTGSGSTNVASVSGETKPDQQPIDKAEPEKAGEGESIAPKDVESGVKMADSGPTPPKAAFNPEETTQVPASDPKMVEVRKPETAKGEVTPPQPEAGSKSGALVEVPPQTSNAPEPMVGVTPALDSQTADLAAGTSHGIRLDDVTDEAKPAAEALKKFLMAANLEERVQHTLAADLMRPIMERYYASNPAGPIAVDAIALVRYDPKPQIGGGPHAIFGLESKTWEFPVPVMLELNEGRFKVDWLSFVEFKDRLLEKFLQSAQEGAARFHVAMTRTHYFEDKVPHSTDKDAFRISPAPPNPFASVVFVDRDSDLGRELREKIPWGAQVWAIVELEWTKLGSQQWVKLAAVPQLNWYSVPSAPKAVRAAPDASSSLNDAPAVPTETQKAVPIGR